jgi:branched-chain amino acid transport system substrate-binding protein
MKKSWMWVIGIVLFLAIIAVLYYNNQPKEEAIKIGIITDLTGPAAYWGESTRVGAELAAQDLKKEGYDVQLIYEDYQPDASKALTSAQKLVNVDNVDAIYAEFNPAAISVASFVKDKNILFVYDAAVTSPLKDSLLAYKTYLDYKEGCRQISKKFKEKGISKIGVLKVNLEFGELCLDGVREVYGEQAYFESYNLGDQDFKTQLLKLNNNGVGAVINVGFEGDTLNTLKTIKEQGLNIKYGTVDDTITKQVTDLYNNELNGSWSFGFAQVSPEFSQRISENKLSTEYGAAITYTHIKPMVKAAVDCNKDKNCIIKNMDESKADNTIGFNGFSEHIANLDMQIKTY